MMEKQYRSGIKSAFRAIVALRLHYTGISKTYTIEIISSKTRVPRSLNRREITLFYMINFKVVKHQNEMCHKTKSVWQ